MEVERPYNQSINQYTGTDVEPTGQEEERQTSAVFQYPYFLEYTQP